MACTVCDQPCALVYYRSAEEAGNPVPWGPGYRSLYCHIADDVDFCGAYCSTRYYSNRSG